MKKTELINDKFFMMKALKLANLAKDSGEVPIGAVLVLDNKIIGSGCNCPISSSDPTAHAEIMALRDAAKNLKNYRLPETTLYVTLEPCVMCVGAMIHARIRRLVFGAFDLKTGAVSSVFNLLDFENHNHKIIYEGGLLNNDCASLLVDFFKSKR
jgi:tRNA(adenine34) deaminase